MSNRKPLSSAGVQYVIDLRTATPHFPGIGRYAVSLARAVAEQLHTDETLVLLTPPGGTWPVVLTPNARVRTIPISASPFSLTQQWELRALLGRLAQERATLYHSLYFLMPYLPGVPTVWTFHDLIPVLFSHMASLRTRLVFDWATRLALRTAAHKIAVSHAAKADLASHYPVDPAQITVAPHGVDERFHPQPAATTATLRQRLGLPETFVLYLGSNKPHKNLPALVTAYARLPASAPPLVIAGAWDTRYSEAQDLAATSGIQSNTRFLGPIDDADLPALYAAATAFVFPSHYEGFGLPVLEAMACGTPVACSNVSSLPEVAGDAALVFDPADTVAMAQTIARLLDEPSLRYDLRSRGLAQAARFAWEQTAAITLGVYRKLRHS